MSHKHPVFKGQISSSKNAKKSRKHLLRRATTLSILSQKQIARSAEASGSSARLPHCSVCSKPVHNHFLKNQYWTRSQLVKYCFLHPILPNASCAGSDSDFFVCGFRRPWDHSPQEILQSIKPLTNEAERTLDSPRQRNHLGKIPWSWTG